MKTAYDARRRDIMTVAAIRHHCLFPQFAILAGCASVLAFGLLTVGAVLSTTSDARTASTPTFSTFERVVEAPEMMAIVPSPVIDTSGQFFFGTGDGCAGYYAQDPSQ